MPNTTNYSWATPADTDLVKDGAAAIRTLGSSADTTVKNLNPGTTAGDIDYYTSGTAKARIAIGTAGQVLQVNSGATAPQWATPASGGALILISTTSFSSVASQSINDVFSSTYTNYKIIINCNTSINTQMDWRFRVSGSDDSNANYNGNRIETSGASSLTATGSYSATAGGIAYIATTQGAVLLEVFNPQASRPTFWHGLGAQFATSSYNRVNFAGAYNGTTSFTGFTLLPASGNITGEVSVYGYSK
jgi:hypothetical protein